MRLIGQARTRPGTAPAQRSATAAARVWRSGFRSPRGMLAWRKPIEETTERTMIRYVVATIVAGATLVCAADAQAPDSEGNRYQFNQVQDGYLRLDLRSGAASLCSRGAAGWSCLSVPDDRTAFDAEL